jgi:hypothetical protein
MNALSYKPLSWSRRERARRPRRLASPRVPSSRRRHVFCARFGLLRPVWVFLEPGCFAVKAPVRAHWISLDFPWILSSEMSLFDGLREIFWVNFFMGALGPRGGAAGPADRRFPALEERNCSWVKPSHISGFTQSIVVASDQYKVPALMLRSEAVARRETGVLPNAPWPRVSKHAPEAGAVRALWSVLRDAPSARLGTRG